LENDHTLCKKTITFTIFPKPEKRQYRLQKLMTWSYILNIDCGPYQPKILELGKHLRPKWPTSVHMPYMDHGAFGNKIQEQKIESCGLKGKLGLFGFSGNGLVAFMAHFCD